MLHVFYQTTVIHDDGEKSYLNEILYRRILSVCQKNFPQFSLTLFQIFNNSQMIEFLLNI